MVWRWIAMGGAVAVAASAQAPWTIAQMATDLDEIGAAVREQWSYLDDRREHFGIDVDAMLRAAKATLPAVHSADDFARTLRQFVAGLEDGHAWSFVPGATDDQHRRLPFVVAPCAEGLVVTAVADEVAPLTHCLFVALDGEPIATVLTELEREVCGSTNERSFTY